MKTKRISLYEIFYLFLYGSIFGWFVEGLWTLIKKGMLINHSALVLGPFNVIYGIGTVMLTIFLIKNNEDSVLKIFIRAFITGSILEYVASLYMEYTLGFVAWNYSSKFMNLNGRICLSYSIFWGILGILWIKIIYPKIEINIDKIPKRIGNKFIKIISIFLIFDLTLTSACVNRAKSFEKGISPTNKVEVIMDKYFGVSYLNNMYNNRWNRK